MVSALTSPILHFVVRAVMHTKRESEFPSWIRRGGCAINKCREASLLGADGVVDQCCEATLQMLAKPSLFYSVRFAGICKVASRC